MSVQLVFDDDTSLSLPLDDYVREACLLQYDRALNHGDADMFQHRLATCLATTLTDCLDADLKPPTEAQLRYATSIARAVGVALPFEALRFRGVMAEFIGRFADQFREKRRGSTE